MTGLIAAPSTLSSLHVVAVYLIGADVVIDVDIVIHMLDVDLDVDVSVQSDVSSN